MNPDAPAHDEQKPTVVLRLAGAGWYSGVSDGGDTVSTETAAARRHAGRHVPAIAWKNNNWQLTVGTRSLTKS